MQVLFKLDFYLHVGSHFVKRQENVVCAASVANETLSWLSSFRTRTILGKHWENWNNNNLCIFPQAFLIAFTSQFLPKMLYRGTISPDGSLQGYTNYSLAWAPVNSTSVPCRYVWVYIQYGVKYLFKTHKIYLQVERWALGQWKGQKNALNNNICCELFKIIFLSVLDCLESFRLEITKCYAYTKIDFISAFPLNTALKWLAQYVHAVLLQCLPTGARYHKNCTKRESADKKNKSKWNINQRKKILDKKSSMLNWRYFVQAIIKLLVPRVSCTNFQVHERSCFIPYIT